MNSFSFGLLGSFWLMLILLVMSIILTVFTYKKTVPPISSFFRILLICLRSCSIFLLIVIVFEPVLNLTSHLEKKPQVAVLLDNSISMTVNTNNYKKGEVYKNVLEKLDLSGLDYKVLPFSESVSVSGINSLDYSLLKLDGRGTNIERAIKYVNNNLDAENFSSVILISDGVHNQGNSPIPVAQELARPIFSIGVGDSITPKDIVLKEIITNKLGFLDSEIPVLVNFKSNGFDNQEVTVSIYEQDKKFDEHKVLIQKNQTDYQVFFTYKPTVEGNNKITVKISALEGEVTTANNQSFEYIKINKNKRKFLIVAGSATADITFIKAEIAKNKTVSVKEFVQKQQGDFYSAPTKQDFIDAEMIILIAYPNKFSPTNVTQMVKDELSRGKSLIYIPSADIDYKKASILQEYLGYKVVSLPSIDKEELVRPVLVSSSSSSSILKIDGSGTNQKLWNDLPPLFKKNLTVELLPTADKIMTFAIDKTNFDDPLMISNEVGNSKSLVFLGYGVYKWKFSSYTSDKTTSSLDLFDILLNNTVKWLSIENLGKTLIVSTSKNSYNLGETVEIFAQVYNKTSDPIENAEVSTKIGSNEVKSFQNIGNGRYVLKVNGLKEGNYTANIEAKLNSQQIGKENIAFTVEKSNQEYSEITLNKSLLMSLSKVTQGKYYDVDNFESLNQDIKKSDFHFEKVSLQKKEIVLWNYPYILAIIILLLSVEWFIRKRLGLL